MTDKSANFELLEPSSPENLIPDPWLEASMIIVAAVLLFGLIVLAVWIFKKNRQALSDPLAIRRIAHAEAATALATIKLVPAQDAAVQSSLILRKYLATAAADPALFETHEEYLARHHALQAFSASARHAAELGFSRLAAIKYSAATPHITTAELIAESQTLLEILHHGFAT